MVALRDQIGLALYLFVGIVSTLLSESQRRAQRRAEAGTQQVLNKQQALEQEIVERKRAEEQIRRFTTELEQRVIERTAQLRAVNRSLEQEIAERKRIEETRARLATILETTSDFVGIADPQGRVSYINRAGRRLVGLAEDADLSGMTIPDFYPEWVWTLIEGEGLPAAAQKGFWEGATVFLARDGREIPVSQVILAHKSADGAVEFFSTIARDITGLKREEEVRRQSEFRFRTVADFTWDWEFWMGTDRRFVYVSPSCERITQYSRAEFMESDSLFLDIVHPQDLHTVQAKLEQAFARAAETGFDYRILCKDGAFRWVSMAFQPIMPADGTFLGVRGSIRDITERKKAEASLKKIEWLLTKKLPPEEYVPPYGNLLALNTSGEILRSVGESTLVGIVRSYLDLLGTSAAVYEKNGDYACGIFSSGWCRLMDQASRHLCGTGDNRAALQSGKWLCHESCWNDASKVSMETDQENDIPCKGGIRLYAVPIRAGEEVIGSLNFGYGPPPQDPQKLRELAEAYGVPVEQLLQLSCSYEAIPPFILDLAKKNARAAAQVLGDMVLRKRAEEAVRLSEERYRNLFETSRDGLAFASIEGVIEEANAAYVDMLGYTCDEIRGMTYQQLTPVRWASLDARI
ncbi:MAG: PAS domain S-box protein, partial [Nitrospirota bacterium]|nr:PAS domain S-box protein [Nitrospirota bacterium]